MLSKANIKYIQSLHDKKGRDSAGSFVAEGLIVIAEFLQEKSFDLEMIYAEEKEAGILQNSFAEQVNSRLEIVAAHELQKISTRSSPTGVIAIFKKKINKKPASLKGNISLALYDLQDPGNLGSIIRTADWFGIENIFCSLHTADAYNPKVVQSTMASLCRVNIHYVDLEKWLASTEVAKYAATLNGEILKPGHYISEGIVVIGNEAKGIPEAVLKSLDKKITIERKGKAESLNAAVATGIILSMLCK